MAKRGRKSTCPSHLTPATWKRLMLAAQNAIYRCHLPSHAQWAGYGGRGITVHEPWRVDRLAFRRYLGDLPGAGDPDRTLDRIDNDRGYEPGNLRWATWAEQAANRRAHPLEGTGLEGARRRWPLGPTASGIVVTGHRWKDESHSRPEVLVRCACGKEWAVSEASLRNGLKRCRPCHLRELAAMGRAYAGVAPAARRKALDTGPPTA